MFDFAFSEMLLAGLVALIVLGPERLPTVARTAGRWLGRVQQFISNMKSELAQRPEAAEWQQFKADWSATADHLREEMQQLRQVADVPAWERLPEQRTPADFGITEAGAPQPWPPADVPQAGLRHVSLRRQALARRRDVRPKAVVRPQLRVRRQRRQGDS